MDNIEASSSMTVVRVEDDGKMHNDGDGGEEDFYVLNGEMYVGDGAIVEEVQVEGGSIVAVTPDGRVSGCRIGEVGIVSEPFVGMVFPSYDAVESYYKQYAKQEGFGIVRAAQAYSSKFGEEKRRRSGSWTCECFGKADSRHNRVGRRVVSNVQCDEGHVNKSNKCECPVNIYASVNDNGEWVLRKVVVEHENHDPTPSKSCAISIYREELYKHVRRRLFNDYNSGVKIPQIHGCLARERNGVENWVVTERDLRNEVSKVKRLKLKDGDANAMLAYFQKMSANNQFFFHMHRLDDKNTLKDIMWVDARSRAAYEEFGDVVCFDSTYLTNEYGLPFANFVGVNHHGQSILLGCALLSHENTETFEWLFSTWLCCMGGKTPKGILTDQDAAMRKALRTSMGEAHHRWCLWHITEKFCSKLGKYKGYEDFKDELLNAIYDSLDAGEFEDSWSTVIVKYKLTENECLAGLFREKEMWVPAYLRHMFWAGMKTMQ
ncbi:protein FAR1-RELATED SEQUENCE 8-like [Beta vulgaris subsp. vulgaris]|uniref:protein FAR1-RELATED SEQUENCE 8-like n=1 Tax=Beta vulgaris subsp. vulgaris TaxID=3555 RepID=UPI00053FE109|nr:protein FAR1-RELATED SEQUENCE 8-like [Beta vulgaris subsp. vulgaris]